MNDSKGPDFVCIGAQKAGTTWLYENLYAHTDMWLPPVKELHYFNRVRPNEALLGKWDIPHPEDFYGRYIKNQFPPSLKKIQWLRHYYRYRLNEQWYLHLFDERYTGGRQTGDITPGYSTMDDGGVDFARKVLGEDTPIIFILRNPIERAWSSAKMMFRYYEKNYADNDYSDIMKELDQPYIQLGSDYANIIKRWRARFNKVHILTFDRLCNEPLLFLQDISELLKIRNEWDEKKISQVVWGDTQKKLMPAEISSMLTEQYGNTIEETYALTGYDEIKSWLPGQ